MLDGKSGNMSENDIHRRNRIAKLLCEWGLVSLVKDIEQHNLAPISQIKILPHKEKANWELIAKYSIGTKRRA